MVKFIHEHAPKNERFDLEKALKEVEHWDQFNPRPYSARCGIGEEPCKQGYTCEFSICYRPELSFDLSEPLRESVLADEEPEGGEQSAKEL